jgi:hypothetical protein
MVSESTSGPREDTTEAEVSMRSFKSQDALVPEGLGGVVEGVKESEEPAFSARKEVNDRTRVSYFRQRKGEHIRRRRAGGVSA